MKRLVTKRFYRAHLTMLTTSALTAGLLLSATLTYRAHVSSSATATVCTKIHRLDAALSTIIDQAQPTRADLLQISYYRQHPAELERTLKQARRTHSRQIALLRGADCTTAVG